MTFRKDLGDSVSMFADNPPGVSRLAVVTVLYNSGDVLEDCLASIPRETEIVIVDNASVDDGVARAQAVRSDAVIIRSLSNVGFGAGCNLGWRATTRPYVAFVNPDVRLRGDTLEILMQRLIAEEHGIVGPALLDESGTSRACKRQPSPLVDLYGLLPAAARWAPSGWDGKVERKNHVHWAGGTVASVEGACFVVARNDLEAIGGFDEDFFLYYEEESLAARLARLGGRAIYEPRAVAEHLGAASTRKVEAFAVRQFHRSRIIFYRKRDGNARGVLTALLLAFGIAVSMPSCALNFVLRRRHHTTPRDAYHGLLGVVDGMTATLRTDPYRTLPDRNRKAAESDGQTGRLIG
jgi:GT2 family glycosyltransferase